MKKFLKILFSLIGILLFISIALIITIGVSLLDKEDNSIEEIVNNPIETEVLLNDYVVTSLKDLNEDETVDFLLSEYEISYLLDSLKTHINIPFLNIKSMYAIYNEDSTVTFEAPLSFFGFKSIVKGRLDINLSSEGNLYIRISEIKAGKISSDSFLIKNALMREKNAKNITEELLKEGIYVEIDFSNNEFNLRMTKDDIKKSISSLIKTDEKYLYNAIVEEIIGKEDLLKLYFNDEDKIGVKVFLESLKNNVILDYDLEKGSRNMTTLKDEALILMNEGILTIKNSSDIFDYLVRGYEAISDKEKEVIDGLDFSKINIKNKKQYKGIVYKSGLTMAKIFVDSSIQDPINWGQGLLKGYYDITISESNLNELFNSFSFVGTTFAFKGIEDVSYITISNLVVDIGDETLDVYMVIDVNGYYVMANVHAIVLDSKSSNLTLKVVSTSLGSRNIKDESKDSLLKYLDHALKDEDFIKIDSSESTMSLDFSNYLKEGFFEFLISSGLNHISIHLSDYSDGELVIRLSK